MWNEYVAIRAHIHPTFYKLKKQTFTFMMQIVIYVKGIVQPKLQFFFFIIYQVVPKPFLFFLLWNKKEMLSQKIKRMVIYTVKD